MALEIIGAFFKKVIDALFSDQADPVGPAELASIAQLAGLISQDSAAFDAARQAARDAGEDIPPWTARLNQDDRVYWNRVQESTRRRFEAAISSYAIAGASAYVRGLQGNAYTAFLARRFGPTPRIEPALAPPGPNAAAPGRALQHDPNRVLTWTGSMRYDRFGMKQFAATVGTGCDARALLGTFSRALKKVVAPVCRGRAWRIHPGVADYPARPGAKSFEAEGSYTVTNQPYVTREGDGFVIHSDVSGGRGRGGSGTVHLECITATDPRRRKALLVVEFTESTYPMWLQRQSEALVACTLMGVADHLGPALQTMVHWEFRRGDWVHNQLLMIPGSGVVELLRARG